MIVEQMELGLGKVVVCRSVERRRKRVSRATWWFERMRRVVDRALDWHSVPPGRPEQMWFAE